MVLVSTTEDGPVDYPGTVNRTKIYVMQTAEHFHGKKDSVPDMLPEALLKQAVSDVQTFFSTPLKSEVQLRKLPQLQRFRAKETARNAAQSLGWITDTSQPAGNKLSFSECCNSLHICSHEFREKIMKVLVAGPKQHLLYLKEHAEELLK